MGDIFVIHVIAGTIISSPSFHPYFSFSVSINKRFAELPEFTKIEYLHPCHSEYMFSKSLTLVNWVYLFVVFINDIKLP